jgi:hypothetical protein
MLKSLRLSKNFTQRGNIKNGALGTGFKLIKDNIYIYIYITCFSGIYVLSEVGVQIELLISKYSLGKMYGDGAVQKRHFVLKHFDFSHNGVLSFYPLVLVMAKTVEFATCK